MNPISISPPIAPPVMSFGIAAQIPALSPQDGAFAAVFADAPLSPEPTPPKAEAKPDTPLDAEDTALALPIPLIWQQAMTPAFIVIAPDTNAAARPPFAPDRGMSPDSPPIPPATFPAVPPLANARSIPRVLAENSASGLSQHKTDTPTNLPQTANAADVPDDPTSAAASPLPNPALLQQAPTDEHPRDWPTRAEPTRLEQAAAYAALPLQGPRPGMPQSPASPEQPSDLPPPIDTESLIQKPRTTVPTRQESQAGLAIRAKTAPPHPTPQSALLPEKVAETPQSHFEPVPVTLSAASEPVVASTAMQPSKQAHTPFGPPPPQPIAPPDIAPITPPTAPVSDPHHAGQSTRDSEKEIPKETNDLSIAEPVADLPKPGMTVAHWGIDAAAQPTAFTLPPFAEITATPPSLPMLPNPQPKPLAPTLAKIARDTTTGAVELALAPAELGRLHMAITHDGDMVRVTLSAERPETLELLRRNADQLTQEFKQAGFAGSSLNFGQWGAGNSNPQQQSHDPIPAAETPGPVVTASPQSPLPRAVIATSGLDLRL